MSPPGPMQNSRRFSISSAVMLRVLLSLGATTEIVEAWLLHRIFRVREWQFFNAPDAVSFERRTLFVARILQH
jgi:hypothetical protein